MVHSRPSDPKPTSPRPIDAALFHCIKPALTMHRRPAVSIIAMGGVHTFNGNCMLDVVTVNSRPADPRMPAITRLINNTATSRYIFPDLILPRRGDVRRSAARQPAFKNASAAVRKSSSDSKLHITRCVERGAPTSNLRKHRAETKPH